MNEIFDIRPYDQDPYLVFPGAIPFKIKLGFLYPSLRAFVYQKSNLFGDAVNLELAGLDIILKLYNNQGLLVSTGTVIVSNTDTSEIEYQWQPFDLKETGVYYAEFVFTDLGNESFVLPSRERIQIIVF